MLFIKIVHDILEKLKSKKKYIEIKHVNDNKEKNNIVIYIIEKIIYIYMYTCMCKKIVN